MIPFELYQSSYDHLHSGDYEKAFAAFEYRWHTETFIEFSQLNKENVLNWVWTQVNKTEMEFAAEAQILAKENPPTIQMVIPD